MNAIKYTDCISLNLIKFIKMCQKCQHESSLSKE